MGRRQPHSSICLFNRKAAWSAGHSAGTSLWQKGKMGLYLNGEARDTCWGRGMFRGHVSGYVSGYVSGACFGYVSRHRKLLYLQFRGGMLRGMFRGYVSGYVSRVCNPCALLKPEPPKKTQTQMNLFQAVATRLRHEVFPASCPTSRTMGLAQYPPCRGGAAPTLLQALVAPAMFKLLSRGILKNAPCRKPCRATLLARTGFLLQTLVGRARPGACYKPSVLGRFRITATAMPSMQSAFQGALFCTPSAFDRAGVCSGASCE